jgi:hypothetical protein
VVVFRCTQRVVRRFGLAPSMDTPPSSGLLGDWYANLLNVGASRFVLCLNERTLLPIILPARNDAFPGAFGDALDCVLRRLGVSADQAAREAEAARKALYGRTRSRVVLGALNDFAHCAGYMLGDAPRLDPLEAALRLAQMPSKPIGYGSPDRLVQALFEVGRAS